MIQLKSTEQIEGIRESSRILVETFHHVKKFVRAGIKTKDIDKEVEKFIHSKEAIPSFRGFNGFPASTCISINEEVVHGLEWAQSEEWSPVVREFKVIFPLFKQLKAFGSVVECFHHWQEAVV